MRRAILTTTLANPFGKHNVIDCGCGYYNANKVNLGCRFAHEGIDC